MVIILHPYLPTVDSLPRQQSTWEFFQRSTAYFGSMGYSVWHVPTPSSDDKAYSSALRLAWKLGDTIVVVEHDILPAQEHIVRLVGCPRPWCAVNYPIQAKERERPSAIAGDTLILMRAPEHYTSCRVIEYEGSDTRRDRWVRRDETEADLTALGLTKFSKELTAFHSPPPLASPGDIDPVVSDYVRQFVPKAHVHSGRAEHLHPYTEGSWRRVWLERDDQVEVL